MLAFCALGESEGGEGGGGGVGQKRGGGERRKKNFLKTVFLVP